MAIISVTYTFANSTTADATQVNANFTDIINGTSDGTKSFSIAALTLAGTLTANGAVNLGDATSDDITITGYIATSIFPKTTQAQNIGSTAQCWSSLFLDTGATDGGAIYFNSTTTSYFKCSADGLTMNLGGFGLAFPQIADSGNLAYFARTTLATTFKFNGAGGGTTSSLTLYLQRIGDWVRCFIPICTVNVGTGTNTALVSQTAVPVAYRPLTLTQGKFGPAIIDNGTTLTNAGFIEITTAGIISISKTGTGTAYTSAAALGGIPEAFSWEYFVGTGS